MLDVMLILVLECPFLVGIIQVGLRSLLGHTSQITTAVFECEHILFTGRFILSQLNKHRLEEFGRFDRAIYYEHFFVFCFICVCSLG